MSSADAKWQITSPSTEEEMWISAVSIADSMS